MSGVGFSEFLILCLIGLVVLGPKRLPQVASQIGSWVGQARRMTRVMKRQLEEELNFDEELSIKPPSHPPPRDDDSYSPLHEQPEPADASAVAAAAGDDVDQHESPDDDQDDDLDDAEHDVEIGPARDATTEDDDERAARG